MKPLRLYINNFLCYDNSYIDFSKFSSALIVGKINNNDSYSNGVGKSTIFKAIEFVLFNYVDINFEHIIREDQSILDSQSAQHRGVIEAVERVLPGSRGAVSVARPLPST